MAGKRNGEKGLGMAETLIAVAVLGVSVVTFVASLSTGSIAVSEHGRETVAQQLAQAQMENTKGAAYNPAAVTYPLIAAPAGYAISVGVAPVPNTDPDIQKITVTVTKEGATLLTLADYKVNR